MWPLGLGGGASRGNFGDLAGELGRGVAGEELGLSGLGLGAHLRRGQAGGRARWRPAAAAVGGLIPANRPPGLDNKRAWELQGVLVEVGAARVCGESGRSQGFTVGTKTAAMVAWQRCAPAREGWWPAFIAKLKAVGRSSCAPRQQATVRR
jgi:hypothetical protein